MGPVVEGNPRMVEGGRGWGVGLDLKKILPVNHRQGNSLLWKVLCALNCACVWGHMGHRGGQGRFASERVPELVDRVWVVGWLSVIFSKWVVLIRRRSHRGLLL